MLSQPQVPQRLPDLPELPRSYHEVAYVIPSVVAAWGLSQSAPFWACVVAALPMVLRRLLGPMNADRKPPDG